MPSSFGLCTLRILGALYLLIVTSCKFSLRMLYLYSQSCLSSMASAQSSRMVFKLSGLPLVVLSQVASARSLALTGFSGQNAVLSLSHYDVLSLINILNGLFVFI